MDGDPQVLRLPRRGDPVDVIVTGMDHQGRGAGTALRPSGEALGRAVVRYGLPGSTVRARVVRRRHGVYETVATAVLEPGPAAVLPRCRHFGYCGGCCLQGLDYPAQLELLGQQVQAAFTAAGVPLAGAIAPVLPSEPPWGYRNKVEFTFGSRRFVTPGEPPGAERAFALGLHVPERHEKVLDIERCEIQFPEGQRIVGSARRISRDLGLEPWDVVRQTGLLRYLVLRQASATGEIMVNVVTAAPAAEPMRRWVVALLGAHPEITTVVQNVNRRPASISQGEEEIVHHGPGVIHERLVGLQFAISANTFFQPNTRQAERLVAEVRAAAGLGGGEVVYDLYCGCGTFSLALARRAAAVWGFELVESALADARRNATLNGIDNVHFVAGDIAAAIRPGAANGDGRPPPQVCIVDPPRAGVHPRVIDGLVGLHPRRIVFVACSIHAAAPQIARLAAAGGYAVTRVLPMDMAPHTPHVECVVTLEAAGGGRS